MAIPWFRRWPGRWPAARCWLVSPRERAEPLERLQRRRQMLAGFNPRPGPPETGAVGQLHSGQVERLAVDAGEGQRPVEQLAGLVVGAAIAADAPASSANRGESAAIFSSHMAATYAAASAWWLVRSAASTRSMVTQSACGTHGVKGAGRADGGGLLIGVVEITLTHGGERSRVMAVPADRVHAPWLGPSGHLVGQRPGRLEIAAGGGEQGLDVLGRPQDVIAEGLGEPEQLVEQLVGLLPLAGHVIVDGEGDQRGLHRRVAVARSAVVHDLPQGLPATAQPVDEDRRVDDPCDVRRVGNLAQRADGPIEPSQSRRRGPDRIRVEAAGQAKSSGTLGPRRANSVSKGFRSSGRPPTQHTSRSVCNASASTSSTASERSARFRSCRPAGGGRRRYPPDRRGAGMTSRPRPRPIRRPPDRPRRAAGKRRAQVAPHPSDIGGPGQSAPGRGDTGSAQPAVPGRQPHRRHHLAATSRRRLRPEMTRRSRSCGVRRGCPDPRVRQATHRRSRRSHDASYRPCQPRTLIPSRCLVRRGDGRFTCRSRGRRLAGPTI